MEELKYSDRILLIKDSVISFDGTYKKLLDKVDISKNGYKYSWENEISNKLIMYDLLDEVHDNIDDIVGELCA